MDIAICLLYVPPDASQSHHETLLEYLTTLSCYDHLLTLEDINLPDVDWENYQGYTYTRTDLPLNSVTRFLNKTWLINQPTLMVTSWMSL